jgi:hypothetical protein
MTDFCEDNGSSCSTKQDISWPTETKYPLLYIYVVINCISCPNCLRSSAQRRSIQCRHSATCRRRTVPRHAYPSFQSKTPLSWSGHRFTVQSVASLSSPLLQYEGTCQHQFMTRFVFWNFTSSCWRKCLVRAVVRALEISDDRNMISLLVLSAEYRWLSIVLFVNSEMQSATST